MISVERKREIILERIERLAETSFRANLEVVSLNAQEPDGWREQRQWAKALKEATATSNNAARAAWALREVLIALEKES